MIRISVAGVGILALLESRIASRSIKATSYEAAKRSYSFCFLYAQIATIRDMLIDDLIFLLRKAGDDDEARSYNTVKSSFLNNYKTALKFLHAPKIEQTTTVSHYYPPGHDAKSKYLRDFIKLAGTKLLCFEFGTTIGKLSNPPGKRRFNSLSNKRSTYQLK